MSRTARSAMLLLVLLAALPAIGVAQARRNPARRPPARVMRKAAPAPAAVRPEVQAARLTAERLEIARAQLRASEAARILGVRRGIADRLARPRPACAGTQIREVFPRALFPGDPVLLLGCGFPAKPAVLMSVPGAPSSFTAAPVTRADGTAIEAVVPSLGGFVGPAAVAFRLSGPGPGVVSPGVSLAPEPQILGLDQTDPQASFRMSSPLAPCRGAGHMPVIAGAAFEFIHTNTSPAACTGTDLFQSTRTLRPGWTYESTLLWARCFTRSSPSALEECGAASQATLPEGLRYLAGEATLPRIAIAWTCAAERTCAYGGIILVRGPKGTRPY